MKTKEQVIRELDALFKPLPPEPTPATPSPLPRAPEILEEPKDRTTTVCHPITFSVRVRGTAPITAVWRRNGIPIKFTPFTKGTEGDGIIEFDFDYSHAPLNLEDNGCKFDAVITNGFGSKTSKSVTLTIEEAPKKSALEQAAAFSQVSNAELKRIKAKEKRRLKGLEDKIYEDEKVRFQPHQFYHKLRPATDSHYNVGKGKFNKVKKGLPSRGVDAYGVPNDIRNEAFFNGLARGTGISVKPLDSDPAAMGHRDDTPWWFLDEHCVQDLLLRLANKKIKPGDRFVEGKDQRPAPTDRIKAAGLDYQILYEFYMLRREDQEIFDKYEQAFKDEKAQKKRQRATSSPGAVKKRRESLLKALNALYPLRSDGASNEQEEFLKYLFSVKSAA